METLYNRQGTCCICGQDKTCAGAFGFKSNAAGAAPRAYPEPQKKGLKENLLRSGKTVDMAVCEECAAKEGKKPTLLWILWAAGLILTFGIVFTQVSANPQGSSSVGGAIRFIGILEMVYIVCGIILLTRAGIQSSGLMVLYVILVFTPFGAIPLLILKKQIDQRELVRTALTPRVEEAFKRAVPKPEAEDPDYERRVEMVRKELLRQVTGDTEPVPVPKADKPQPKAAAPEKPDPGNTFYAFVVKGRGFGRPSPDMPQELAEALREDYPGGSGMRLAVVDDYQWNGKVEVNESAGMFTSSAGIGDQIPGIRAYLERLGLSGEAIDAGVAELETIKLQRVNPFGGVFVFGVPIK